MKKTVFTVFLITAVFFGLLFVIPDLHFYFWGDETRQVIPLTISLWRDIRTGNFGFWNWKMSFGASNTIQLLSYLGSPTFWLFLLLPSAEMIMKALPLTAILTMTLSGVFSWLWLNDLVKDDLAKFAGTIIMVFSGWVIFELNYYSYMDAWMYICLLLYSMEEFLQGRKKLLFPIVIAQITVLDLFTMYMASWLILFYMVTRLAVTEEKGSPLVILKKLIQPFLYYLLGLGIAGLVFILDADLLLNSSRAGETAGSFSLSKLFVSPGGLYRLITSLFSPVINDYDHNIYSSIFQEGSIHTYGLYGYSFILWPLLLPQLWKADFREKKPVVRVLLFLSICALLPFSYVLFNGNNAGRWCFYFIIFHVMGIAYLLEHRSQLDRKLLRYSCIGVIALLILFSGAAFVFHTTSDSNRISILTIVPCLLALTIGYGHSLSTGKTSWFRILLVLEALLCLSVRIVNGKTLTIGKGKLAEQYEEALLDTHITDRIQSEDPGFYRISTDEPTAENYMLPMAKNYQSNSSYFSLINTANEHYYTKRISENWFIPFLPSKFLSYSVLGNQYLVLYQENSLVPYGYSQVSEDTSADGTAVRIFKNHLITGLGYAGNVLINAEYANTVDRSFQDYLMAVGILCVNGTEQPQTDEGNRTPAAEGFTFLGAVNNGVLEYSLNESGTLYIDYSNTQPYSAGSYELYKDGEVLTYQEFDEYAYHAVRIEAPIDAIGIYTHNTNFASEQTEVHLYWLPDKELDRVCSERSHQDSITFVKEEKGNITAKITVTEGRKMVATSVPYNEGWTVYVNGEPIKYEMVNTSFIGFELDPGEYDLEFVFVPKWFTFGCALSAFSSLIYLILAIRFLLKRRRDAV